MPLRTYNELSRDDLQTFASNQGVGYEAANQLYEQLEDGLDESLAGTLNDIGINAIGFEFAVVPPIQNHPYSGLSGTIVLGIVWLVRETSPPKNSMIYLAALAGNSGPTAVKSSPPGGTSGWPVRGTFFAVHYSGQTGNVTPSEWKASFEAASVDAGNESRVLLGSEFVGKKVQASGPQLLVGSGDTWYGFGTDVSIAQDNGSLSVTYSNGRYRNFKWLLGQLGILDLGRSVERSHPFIEVGSSSVPDWAPDENLSGSFTVGQPTPGLEVYGDDPLYHGITGRAADVRQLQVDLWKLGFWFKNMAARGDRATYADYTTTTNELQSGHASGDFNARTAWALREFQIYASLDTVAQEQQMTPPSGAYADTLTATTNDRQYTGDVTGILDDETATCIQHWLANDYRCPVVIEARSQSGGSGTFDQIEAENIWVRDHHENNAHRMFVKDISGQYQDLDGNDPADSNNVRSFTPDGRVVLGEYSNASATGPVSHAERQVWADGELVPEHLVVERNNQGDLVNVQRNNLSNAQESTYKVVRSVGEVECEGFFDVVNSYDRAVVSVGPCHWTLTIGRELPGYLSYLESVGQGAFDDLLGSRDVSVDTAWGNDGGNLYSDSSRTYTANLRLLYHDGTAGQPSTTEDAVRARDEDYFRNWHWFYRWVMAGRTNEGYRERMWHMARVRIRDVLETEFAAGAGVPNAGGRNARIGDVFQSERAAALLLRWHVFRPDDVVTGDGAGGTETAEVPAEAYSQAQHLSDPTDDLTLDPTTWPGHYGEHLANGIFREESNPATLNITGANVQSDVLSTDRHGNPLSEIYRRDSGSNDDWALIRTRPSDSDPWNRTIAARGAVATIDPPSGQQRTSLLRSLSNVNDWPSNPNQFTAENHSGNNWYTNTLGSLSENHGSFSFEEGDLPTAPYTTRLNL